MGHLGDRCTMHAPVFHLQLSLVSHLQLNLAAYKTSSERILDMGEEEILISRVWSESRLVVSIPGSLAHGFSGKWFQFLDYKSLPELSLHFLLETLVPGR